jgi:SAM-dependent methyltransferase
MVDAVANRLSQAVLGTFDLFSVYLGERLGFYRKLDTGGPATSIELAQRAGTDERYAREWLEQQAVTGFLSCNNPEAGPLERRYSLPEGFDQLFVDPTNMTPMAAYARIVAGTLVPLDALIEAYRTGAGVPYEEYGADLAEGQAAVTRPLFTHYLAKEWIPAIPKVDARLRADPPARVADIGMGFGWSSIEIARGYPSVRVDGFDLDEASVLAANANAEHAGVSDRVTFQRRDAGDPELAGAYDFALAFECIHDMANPVATLSAMRRLVGLGGRVLIVDEKTAATFAPNGDDMERSLYGFSIFHCLPVGRVDRSSVETGAVMREETFRRYAAEAEFGSVEVLPIENDSFRFYLLSC